MIKKISLILILFFIPNSHGQKGITVIASDYQSLVFEYKPSIDTSTTLIDFQKYLNLNLSSGSFPSEPGLPAVPFTVISIGVPAEFGNTIEILQSSYTTLQGKITPVPNIRKEGDLHVFQYEISDKYYEKSEKNIVDFGDFGYLRDLPIQNIVLNPVDYSPDINEIKIYNRIVCRINFSGEQKVAEGTFEDGMLINSVVNYSVSKKWVKSRTRLQKPQESSVLSTGKWFRFEAPEEGIYRISRSQLSSFGIDPATVDPRTIKIFNNSGKPLPESIFAPITTDLKEISVVIRGEEDGKFDESDIILFYGRGTNFWEYDSTKGRIDRVSNPYSRENYFWITSGGDPGKRMQSIGSHPDPAGLIQTSTPAFRYLEDDRINIVRSGRVFLGDEFSETVRSRSYMYRLDSRVEGSTVNYEFRFINSDTKAVNFKIEEQQSVIYNRNILGTSNLLEPDYAIGNPVTDKALFTGELSENRSVLKLSFNASGFLSKGYLDFINIRFERYLSALEDELVFHAPDVSTIVEYHLNNFSGSSDIAVFDITDYSNVKILNNPLWISGAEYHFRSAEQQFRGGRYIALRESKFRTPVNSVEIANSNVHGIEGAQYIIITHKNFIQQADRLKEFRENNPKYPLSSVVVDVNEIFNEYSGGLKDVSAIRNFLKYAYDNWTVRPEYVVLFGDGDYDYRNIEGFNINFIPSYQIHYTKDSEFWRNVHQIFSYPIDDYFVRISGPDDSLIDLAIGRLNIQSTADAQRVVDKIIKYESDLDKSTWRNLITLLADDAYTSRTYEGTLHVGPSEDIAINSIPASFDINKIYMSSYPVEHTSAGKRKPSVTRAILDAMNQGTVLFNFMGHGSPSLWTHEVVFDKTSTLPMLKNEKLFFLVAATCDFGYFDNPSDQSATELLVLKENSGAIGGFTASRPVYVYGNIDLSKEFFKNLFYSERDADQSVISIGKIYMMTRKTKHQENDLKYHLFGDPALKLLLPQYKAEIASVNGSSLSEPVQIQALGKVHLEGFIKKDDLNRWEDYNGEGILSVFDSYRTVKLGDVNFDVRVQGGLIFKGLVSINNGNFAADFTVPKDISYENRNGKAVLYFYNQGTDGISATQNILINGTDSSAVNDGKGPGVEIFFDTPEYRNSYLVDPNTEIIVHLEDETGLNTTGTGVGHRLEGILNDKENEPIDFTTHFTGNKDAGGKSGEVRYRFDNLAEGDYKILVKAWDVFNNFSSKTEYFTVMSSEDKDLRYIYNYPNPFTENTVFTFQQNFNSPIDVKIKIYTISGRLIRQLERYSVSQNESFVKVDWDGRDEDGDKIANGTYLYKVIVYSTDGEFTKSALGKLAIIN